LFNIELDYEFVEKIFLDYFFHEGILILPKRKNQSNALVEDL
jgi:hypothetical protein